jgi:prepilin-type N-terminal cleavage/methylation domain-containing protein
LKTFRKSYGAKGITLIELVVVMAIIAIMAAFMAPAIGEWMENYRIRQTARDIASTFQEAKMRAISSRQQYNVLFDTSATYQLTPGGTMNSTPRGVQITSFPTTVLFNTDGTSTGGTITVDSNKRQYQISVSVSGRISIVGQDKP